MLIIGKMKIINILSFYFSKFRHCAVADELNGLIYMVGGYYTSSPNKRRSARKYNIALDKWQSLYDNSLQYDADVRKVCEN